MNDFSNLIIWNKSELPEKSGIYLIENILNKKIYIGQSKNIKERIRNHFKSNDDLYFHRAVRKYGEINFNIYILEFTENLNEREIYYINKYKSNKLGYNLTMGGEGHLGTSLTDSHKKLISESTSKETWGYNYVKNIFYSASSRKELANILCKEGYDFNYEQKIYDAIQNKSYSGEFTFGNSKEEALETSKHIKPPKKYELYLFNYKTGEISDRFNTLTEGENFIKSKGYKISNGHLYTAIKNNNRYIKDFIFGTSKEEILFKINNYGIITYCYNLNDNSLYRFTESIEDICKKLEKMYNVHFCRGSVGKVKKNKQTQTLGFIFDSNMNNLIKRVSEFNANCCEKIFALAKDLDYLNSQELLEWQDKLNSISTDYDGK